MFHRYASRRDRQIVSVHFFWSNLFSGKLTRCCVLTKIIESAGKEVFFAGGLERPRTESHCTEVLIHSITGYAKRDILFQLSKNWILLMTVAGLEMFLDPSIRNRNNVIRRMFPAVLFFLPFLSSLCCSFFSSVPRPLSVKVQELSQRIRAKCHEPGKTAHLWDRNSSGHFL